MRTIKEKQCYELSEKLFGGGLLERIMKLNEEVQEMADECIKPTIDNELLKGELADVAWCINVINQRFGFCYDDLLLMAYEKNSKKESIIPK